MNLKKLSRRVSGKEKKQAWSILLYAVPAVLLIGTLSGLTSAFVADVTQSLGLKVSVTAAVVLFSVAWILVGFLLTKD